MKRVEPFDMIASLAALGSFQTRNTAASNGNGGTYHTNENISPPTGT
ncbi:MAG: hypothetical protein IPK01_16145 [Acidobacteria bacterium]|nr:hypothetical protein [Acidobacteriota bacterium]